MVSEQQTPRVTVIQVRIDCNGCVQKIKKALNGINGIHDFYVDFQRQKLTVIGLADPEKVLQAIKKTRKNATICSHIEPTLSPSKPKEPEPEGKAPAPDAAKTLKDTPQHEQPPAEATPSPTTTENNASQLRQSTPSPGTQDVGEVHGIYHHLPSYHDRPVFLHESPQSVTHSYHTYMPSPFVTGYEYLKLSPRHTHYNCREHCSGDYQNAMENITSMFSDENPNACRIV